MSFYIHTPALFCVHYNFFQVWFLRLTDKQLKAKLEEMKKQGGSSEPPYPVRNPEKEISSGSPTAPSDTVHPVNS